MSRVLQSMADPVPFYVFDDLPSPEQLSLVRQEGYGIRISDLPAGLDNADFLAPMADSLEYLSIMDARCTDPRIVSRFTSLKGFTLNSRPKVDVDLRNCPLETYFGPHRRVESVEDLTTLKELTLYPPVEAGIGRIQSRLNRFSVVFARGMKGMPRMEHPETVTTISIDGPRDFDVTGMEEYTGLQVLHLSAITRLTGMSALVNIPSLGTIAFDRCRTVNDPEPLLSLRPSVKVDVFERSPFDADFKRKALASEAHWTFPQRVKIDNPFPWMTDGGK